MTPEKPCAHKQTRSTNPKLGYLFQCENCAYVKTENNTWVHPETLTKPNQATEEVIKKMDELIAMSKEYEENWVHSKTLTNNTVTSDGSTASYYELPPWACELADLIRYKNMNGSQSEMFRALYRGSTASHSDERRQAKKVLAYAVDEIVRTHFPNESMAKYRDAVFEVFTNDQV